MADTGITVLITGSRFEGHRPEEDVGITIKEKMEMSCACRLTAAFVTRMHSELCGVSRLGWGGDGQGDTTEPAALPALMGSSPFDAVRDGEPRPSLLSAGGEALSQELIKSQWGEQHAPEQPTAEKQAEKVRAESNCPGEQALRHFGVEIRGVRSQLPPWEVCSDPNPWLCWALSLSTVKLCRCGRAPATLCRGHGDRAAAQSSSHPRNSLQP